jgi:hypothetical protein
VRRVLRDVPIFEGLMRLQFVADTSPLIGGSEGSDFEREPRYLIEILNGDDAMELFDPTEDLDKAALMFRVAVQIYSDD